MLFDIKLLLCIYICVHIIYTNNIHIQYVAPLGPDKQTCVSAKPMGSVKRCFNAAGKGTVYNCCLNDIDDMIMYGFVFL